MTQRGGLYRIVVGFVAVAAMAACADGPTGPGSNAPASVSGYNVPAGATANASLLGGLLGTVGSLLTPEKTMMRTVALPQDISTSALVTAARGGTLSIPAAGITVVVPPGAVRTSMTITMTALKGKIVAYDFGPSGTQFQLPLIVTQSTRGTNINLLTNLLSLGSLHAAYFANDNQLNEAQGTALVDEILPLLLDPLSGNVTFSIKHFSGYLLTTGSADGGDDGAGIGM